jgi:hypothetical protein
LIVAVSGSIAPVASALPADFTWKGAALSERWSNTANWVGGVAPSGAVGTLSFPQLTSAACLEFPPTAACNLSENDLTGISAKALKLDDGGFYEIWGNGIALGEGGLTASTTSTTPSGVFFELPLELSASQTWSIDGNNLTSGVVLGANVTGSGSNLGVRLGHKGFLVSTTGFEASEPSDLETGAVTIEGANPAATASENGAVDLVGGRMNASDEKPVN